MTKLSYDAVLTKPLLLHIIKMYKDNAEGGIGLWTGMSCAAIQRNTRQIFLNYLTI